MYTCIWLILEKKNDRKYKGRGPLYAIFVCAENKTALCLLFELAYELGFRSCLDTYTLDWYGLTNLPFAYINSLVFK